MTDIQLIKINMQVRMINNLLDAGNTPQIKIDMETRALTEMLKKFSYTRSKAPEYEKTQVYNNLKALQHRLKKYDITGGQLS